MDMEIFVNGYFLQGVGRGVREKTLVLVVVVQEGVGPLSFLIRLIHKGLENILSTKVKNVGPILYFYKVIDEK